MESVPTLIVVPARAENAEEIEPLLQTLVSVTATAPDAMVLVVDDRSPAPQAQMIEVAATELDCAYVLQQDGEGDSAALQRRPHGRRRARHGRLLRRLRASSSSPPAGSTACAPAPAPTASPPRSPAAPSSHAAGTIRQAGYFFSRFRRAWRARLRNVPEILLDVDQPLLCPVSTELQLVRNEWIERVGLYDELLDGPHAALDYCIRVSEAGGQCVLEPTVRGARARSSPTAIRTRPPATSSGCGSSTPT